MNDLKNITTGVELRKDALERVGDLINIDGPLLTLFHDRQTDALLVYDWMDNDHFFNRYIIYEVSPKNILSYIGKKITHMDLFNQAKNKVYFFADIDHRALSEYKIYRLESLPKEYSHTESNYFSEDYCSDTVNMIISVSRITALQNKSKDYKRSSNVSAMDLSEGGLIARIGLNLIESEQLKTTVADVRQTYSIPELEGMEILGGN